MYLKKITLENVGPISNLQLEMPFKDGMPQPLVLVGANGSGKTTVISFVVNSLIYFKQLAYEAPEVEWGRTYRVRTGLHIRDGCTWYHAKVEFGKEMHTDEWVLNAPRKVFQASNTEFPTNDAWKKIPEETNSVFYSSEQPSIQIQFTPTKKCLEAFEEGAVLYFPSDRGETPDWVNEPSVTQEVTFSESNTIAGHTTRQILSKTRLKKSLEWLKSVILDALLSERILASVWHNGAQLNATIGTSGPSSRAFVFIREILQNLLSAEHDSVNLLFGHRYSGHVAVHYRKDGLRVKLPTLFGLSAGQASLFCIFSAIVRDFDLTLQTFNSLDDIRGLVIIDEADLHLHVDLQMNVLPKLIRLFPKVQFILTAHSPMFLMGMKNEFGNDFKVIEMPDGKEIDAEEFSEFTSAVDAFSGTNRVLKNSTCRAISSR